MSEMKEFNWLPSPEPYVIQELKEEIERLRAELDLCHQSMGRMAHEAVNLRAVVDAARKWQKSPVNRRDEADLHDALRALDGEPCPTCGGSGRKG